jgi:hypothetical protein
MAPGLRNLLIRNRSVFDLLALDPSTGRLTRHELQQRARLVSAALGFRDRVPENDRAVANNALPHEIGHVNSLRDWIAQDWHTHPGSVTGRVAERLEREFLDEFYRPWDEGQVITSTWNPLTRDHRDTSITRPAFRPVQNPNPTRRASTSHFADLDDDDDPDFFPSSANANRTSSHNQNTRSTGQNPYNFSTQRREWEEWWVNQRAREAGRNYRTNRSQQQQQHPQQQSRTPGSDRTTDSDQTTESYFTSSPSTTGNPTTGPNFNHESSSPDTPERHTPAAWRRQWESSGNNQSTGRNPNNRSTSDRSTGNRPRRTTAEREAEDAAEHEAEEAARRVAEEGADYDRGFRTYSTPSLRGSRTPSFWAGFDDARRGLNWGTSRAPPSFPRRTTGRTPSDRPSDRPTPSSRSTGRTQSDLPPTRPTTSSQASPSSRPTNQPSPLSRPANQPSSQPSTQSPVAPVTTPRRRPHAPPAPITPVRPTAPTTTAVPVANPTPLPVRAQPTTLATDPQAYTGPRDQPLALLTQLAADPTGTRTVIGLIRPVDGQGNPRTGPPTLLVTVGTDRQGRVNYRVVGRTLDGQPAAGAGRSNSLAWTGLQTRGLVLLGRFHGANEAEIRFFAQQRNRRTDTTTGRDRLPLADRSPDPSGRTGADSTRPADRRSSSPTGARNRSHRNRSPPQPPPPPPATGGTGTRRA